MEIMNEIFTAMETEQEGFVVDNDSKADWCLKIIKAETDEAGRLMQLADSQIEELVNKKLEIKEKLDHKTGYLKGLLYRYFETVQHKETKTQESYKLLNGSLVYKKASRKIVKPDEGQLAEYMLHNGFEKMVETVYKPKWVDFKKEVEIRDDKVILSDTGEVLDFVGTEDVPASFDIK